MKDSCAEYLKEISHELAGMAEDNGLDALGLIFRMAEIEAIEIIASAVPGQGRPRAA